MLLGFMTLVMGMQADLIANNRKLLEDIQYRVRRLDFNEDERDRLLNPDGSKAGCEKTAGRTEPEDTGGNNDK